MRIIDELKMCLLGWSTTKINSEVSLFSENICPHIGSHRMIKCFVYQFVGYTGDLCNVSLTDDGTCESKKLCRYNSTCTNNRNKTGFRCNCPDGYFGSICAITECPYQPCNKCFYSSIFYICDCPAYLCKRNETIGTTELISVGNGSSSVKVNNLFFVRLKHLRPLLLSL